MKILKIVLIVSFIFAVCFLFAHFCITYEPVSDAPIIEPTFIELERNSKFDCIIVYHRETLVMYSVSNGYSNGGTLTPLLNSDGTPMIYNK